VSHAPHTTRHTSLHLDVLNPGEGADVTRLHLLNGDAVKVVVHKQLIDLANAALALWIQACADRHLLPLLDGTLVAVSGKKGGVRRCRRKEWGIGCRRATGTSGRAVARVPVGVGLIASCCRW